MPAACHVQRPERRVLQGHIAYGKVFDCFKQHHARAECLAEFRAFVEAVVHILVQKHLVALTVDRAHAADGHIFGVGCTQKEAALPAIGSIVRVHAVSPLGEQFDIYRVQAADKDRAAFQVKFHIIFQQYRPTQILPGRNDDTPAACRRGRIHSVLNSSCAVCPSVRHRTAGKNVVFHCSAPPGRNSA